MSIAGRVRALAAVGPRGWSRVVRTVLVARRIERSLVSEPLDETAKRFGVRLSFDPPTRVAEDVVFDEREAADIRLALRVISHRPFNGTCLRRALIMGDILRDRDPLLRVGVAKDAGRVQAHAWVEIDGIALDPMADREYTALVAPSKSEAA